MAIINYDEKWIYFMEPHTASRAVHDALLKNPACQYVDPHHATLEQITNTVPMEKLLGFDSICTVRNPFDMLVSRWRLGKGQFKKFSEWVAESIESKQLQPKLSGLWRGCNIVCWFENLQDDLNYVLPQSVQIEYNPKHKTLDKQRWQDYYDKETFDAVMKYFSDYIEEFGYKFEDTENNITTWIDSDAKRRYLKKVGYGRHQ